MINAVLITISATLFVHLGLAEAIFDTDNNIVINCPKCLTFWAVLLYLTLSNRGLILAIGTAFICAYLSLWLGLLIDFLNKKYNKISDEIHKAEKE